MRGELYGDDSIEVLNLLGENNKSEGVVDFLPAASLAVSFDDDDVDVLMVRGGLMHTV